jgi:hypothetical protein
MDEEPDDQGNVRNIHFLVTGATIGGFRVEKLALEASFVELNAPSKWDPKAKDPIEVKNALRSNLEAVILERTSTPPSAGMPAATGTKFPWTSGRESSAPGGTTT